MFGTLQVTQFFDGPTPPPLIMEEVSNYVYLRQIYKSRNLFMYGSFEIYNFYKFISVKVNLRWFFIFMLMYNAS